MLGWYIPALSELPLRNRLLLLLTCRTSPAVLCFAPFNPLGTLGPFSLFLFHFMCVRLLRPRHGERAWRRYGRQRMLTGSRSEVAAFVTRRRVCLDTRGMHKRALSGLNLMILFFLFVSAHPIYYLRTSSSLTPFNS